MNRRIKSLKLTLKYNKVGTFLVTDPANLFYLTGYTGSNGMFLLHDNQTKPIFYTDFRYQEQVKHEVSGCQIKIWDRSLFTNFPVEDIQSVKQLGFESNNLSFANYTRIKKQIKGKTKMVPLDYIVEYLRRIKDNTELQKIKDSVLVTDKVFKNILTLIKPSITEKELANEIDFQFRKYGDIAFPTIVAFGARGALPHAQPTNKKLKSGDVIVFDIGAKINNYCADMTRTIIFGKASAKVKKVYEIVLSAQRLAEQKIMAGKRAVEIDSYARNYIKDKGYAKYFGHGLGHGVGIMVHEGPTLSSQSKENLVINETVTVEPGIYLPGEFGVRIEDLVVIKEKGCEILTKSPKELIEL
jgi:Xaa-Pro aminopeptidase